MNRLLEGVEHQVGAHRVRDLPADDPAGEDVNDEGRVDEAVGRGHVGEVGYPQLIRPRGAELSVHEIRHDRSGVGPRGHDGAAAADGAPQPQHLHEPFDGAPRDHDAALEATAATPSRRRRPALARATLA